MNLDEIKSALDQAVNGSHLDTVPNHDDDSLFEIADRAGANNEGNKLFRHAVRLSHALDLLHEFMETNK